MDSDSGSDSNGAPGDSRGQVIHDFKMMREGFGVSQRDLAERTQIPQATLSRIEAFTKQPTLDQIVRITTALGADVTEQPIYKEVVRKHQARPGIRRAFICLTCHRRVFLSDEPAVFVPECAEHGRMVRQANMPYQGQSTEPDPKACWPEPGEGVAKRDAAMRDWQAKHG